MMAKCREGLERTLSGIKEMGEKKISRRNEEECSR